jgi:hypothetical protein
MSMVMLVIVLMIVWMRVHMRMSVGRSSKANSRPRPRFRGFHCAIARRRLRRQRVKQLLRDPGHTLDCAIERFLVRLRRPAKSAEFSDELKSRGANLVLCRRRHEVMQRFNISAHKISLG